MHNLSRTGCRVECDRAVLQGSYMTLRLLLPDGIRSLIVELAAVRWVRERYFGIEFLRLPASEQARIEQFLTRHHR
jgi:PilZ domain.